MMSDFTDKNSDSAEPENEPKIVVDSDWKEQVAKEKEAAARKAQQAEQADPQSVAPEPTSDSAPEPELNDESVSASNQGDTMEHEAAMQTPPPASFEVLISMLFTQAMASLGQIPDPASGKPSVNKPFAKHYIDQLDMLSEKTKGNLSDSETKMLSEALHALRMMYVNVRQP